ncbi:alpha/beta hydrolase [Elizabethkingia sp. HX WHF]|uniref:alpha/beta hydrolase n=1 Tax=Elizabethkingia TaxID=308865 RepID=UPI0009992888|nr:MULTISPECIES: alpha/beta hydrolase [Elizabethkingia]ATL45485.1 alpha/beta hydrolase [Elizabethkingia miricola]MCL1637030.1 alpha/beta hydrolase [Elizabethkingia bruuniana]MDX8563735.1 alpha/beta hydrolase [Elizabethkingia sp. HX WHF]OPC20253.1 alpha/beta hydrolase [Elizabethkingia bruuniana]
MNTQAITFSNIAWENAGTLYFPENFDQNKKYPTIVTMHPIGSCKEQTAGNVYGKALAEAGFVVLAFDASFQGESGGMPRYIENPYQRTDDVRYAVDYLINLPYVDEERIGILGVCGGGAYALNIAMTERRIKAVVSITGVNFGRLLRDGFAGGSPMEVLNNVAQQRSSEAKGRDLLTINMLPDSVEAGKQAGIEDIDVLEATDYYKTSRGQTQGGATSAVYSRIGIGMGWDAFHLCETLLTQPILVVIGDKPGGFGAYRDGFEVVRRAASEKKELLIVKGYSHYDLYDQPEPVRQALERAIPFFKENL